MFRWKIREDSYLEARKRANVSQKRRTHKPCIHPVGRRKRGRRERIDSNLFTVKVGTSFSASSIYRFLLFLHEISIRK
jgi:hypothetical protein